MPRFPESINITDRKIDLISRLYIDTADEDYLSARSAYGYGLFHVFYWCAAQACEKYLKAFLLFQDRSCQKHGHNLTSLFSDALQYDHDRIIPELLNLPETTAMGRENWQGKATSLYIDYLATYGSTDNRYAFAGTFINGPVMHALDILCYSIRKLIRTKNFSGSDLFVRQSAGLADHELITNNQPWMIDPRLRLERLYAERFQAGENQELRNAFSNINFAFFNAIHTEGTSFGGQYFHGSPLYNHLVRLAEIDPSEQNRDAIRQLRDWASERIRISPSVRTQLGLPRIQRR